jgi:hypothetical protein
MTTDPYYCYCNFEVKVARYHHFRTSPRICGEKGANSPFFCAWSIHGILAPSLKVSRLYFSTDFQAGHEAFPSIPFAQEPTIYCSQIKGINGGCELTHARLLF